MTEIIDLSTASTVPTSPYRGLAPYTEDDAAYFFGRDQARQIVEANLMSERLTVVYGESGVGKSSLLRAGVVHHLQIASRRNLVELDTPEFLVVSYSSWQDDPLQGIAAAIRSAAFAVMGDATPPMIDQPDLASTIQAWSQLLDVDLLFIFDQFEEYFLYHGDDDPFVEQFPDAINRTDLRAHFLVSLREDRLAKLDRFKAASNANLFNNYLRITHLDRESARQAITEPIEVHNRLTGSTITIEPELVEAVLDEVTQGRVTLGDRATDATISNVDDARVETPFLQLVMSRVWRATRDAGMANLREETLRELGGADLIVSSHLEGAMAMLSGPDRKVAADLFRFLITPGGSKIALSAADLASFTGDDESAVEQVLQYLAAGSVSVLRTVPPAPGASALRYEIFHDVLADAITDWRAAYEEKQAAYAAGRELAEQVRRWRRRALFIGIAALLALGVAVGVFFVRTFVQEAELQQHLARAYTLEDPQARLANAVDAMGIRSTDQVSQLLREILSESHPDFVVSEHDGAVWSVAVSPDGGLIASAGKDGTSLIVDAATGEVLRRLEGHDGDVYGVLFTPDGGQVVTWGGDSTIRVWDPADGTELFVLDHEGNLPMLVADTDVRYEDGSYAATGSFSSDGTRLVSASGTWAWVWDLGSGELVHRLDHGDAAVNSAAFSPDGSQIVTSGSDALTRLWDAGSGELDRELENAFDNFVGRSLFSPDGSLLVSAYGKGRLAAWDTGTWERTYDEFHHSTEIRDARFSSAGILASIGDLKLRVGVLSYDADSTLLSSAFSPSGGLVAVTTLKGSVTVLSTAAARPLTELHGNQSLVQKVVFAPQGDRVVTAGEDGTIRSWTLPPGSVAFSDAGVFEPATFDVAGDRYIVAGWDSTATIFDVATGEVLHELVGDRPDDDMGGAFPVAFAGFDESGRRAVTVQSSAGVFVWDTDTGELLSECCANDLGWEPWAAVLLPGSDDRLLVAYTNNTMGVWTLNSDGTATQDIVIDDSIGAHWDRAGERLAVIGRSDPVVRVLDTDGFDELARWDTSFANVTLHPDGEEAAVITANGRVRVLDVMTGEEVAAIPVEDATVAAMSYDGDRMVVGSTSGRVSVWDTDGWRYLGEVQAHSAVVQSVSVTDDGLILSTGRDGSRRIFTCDVCELSDDEIADRAREVLLDSSGDAE